MENTSVLKINSGSHLGGPCTLGFSRLGEIGTA